MKYDDEVAHEDFEARKLAFKLLTAHAVADEGFFERLKADPAAAAAELHILLTDADVARLQGIDWDALEEALPTVRRALNLHAARASW
jgi:hypothetical protein